MCSKPLTDLLVYLAPNNDELCPSGGHSALVVVVGYNRRRPMSTDSVNVDFGVHSHFRHVRWDTFCGWSLRYSTEVGGWWFRELHPSQDPFRTTAIAAGTSCSLAESAIITASKLFDLNRLGAVAHIMSDAEYFAKEA